MCWIQQTLISWCWFKNLYDSHSSKWWHIFFFRFYVCWREQLSLTYDTAVKIPLPALKAHNLIDLWFLGVTPKLNESKSAIVLITGPPRDWEPVPNLLGLHSAAAMKQLKKYSMKYFSSSLAFKATNIAIESRIDYFIYIHFGIHSFGNNNSFIHFNNKNPKCDSSAWLFIKEPKIYNNLTTVNGYFEHSDYSRSDLTQIYD